MASSKHIPHRERYGVSKRNNRTYTDWHEPKHPLWDAFLNAVNHEGYDQGDWERYKIVHGGLFTDDELKAI